MVSINNKLIKIFTCMSKKKFLQPISKTQFKTSGKESINELKNKLIYTSKKKSNNCIVLCRQLRDFFKPNGLSGIKNLCFTQKMIIELNKNLNIDYSIYIWETGKNMFLEMKHNLTQKVYQFEIVDYEDNFKTFANTLYTHSPMVVLNNFGQMNELKMFLKNMYSDNIKIEFKRIILFSVINGEIYLRHFCYNVRDNDVEYVVKLAEIGPRLTLKLLE